MFRKGQQVRTKDHTRHRSIFGNAEVTPGTDYNIKGGKTGTVRNIFRDTGETTYEVRFGQGDDAYYAEYSEDELE